MGYARTRKIPMMRPPDAISLLEGCAALYSVAGQTCVMVSGVLDEGETKMTIVCDVAGGEGMARISNDEILVVAADGHAMMVPSPPPPPLPPTCIPSPPNDSPSPLHKTLRLHRIARFHLQSRTQPPNIHLPFTT